MATDTINPMGNSIEENLILKANSNLSIFYSEKLWEWWKTIASEKGNIINYFLDRNWHNSIAGLEYNIVYRNYTQNLTIDHQRYDLTNWELVESIERPEWVICDSVCTILNYECVMAKTNFRGRIWTAFFTPEIPIKEGPWKLCGLPGIILKASDSQNHYSYEATELFTRNVGIVEFQMKRNRIKIKDRRKGLQYRRKCLSEDISKKIQAAYGLDIKKVRHTPKNYDFEETDYPHE
jgi:GLPGLI family protein